MKTIQIEFGLQGPPKVNPNTEVCLSGETIVFVISSKNPLVEAVNLACNETSAEIFCCANGARQHHCKIDLQDTSNPEMPKGAVIWGIAVEHNAELPRTLKYSIMPFVMGNPYKAGELDPFIIITKRPVAGK
jgi:hypothetical protein